MKYAQCSLTAEDLCSILKTASFPRARSQGEWKQTLPGAEEGIQRVYGAGQKHGRKSPGGLGEESALSQGWKRQLASVF